MEQDGGDSGHHFLHPVSIAQLDPQAPLNADSSISAIVTLLWPYSSSTRSLALLCAEHDFRLRKNKGQVRVQFKSAAAREVASSGVGIGDSVKISLRGARLTQDNTAPKTPGRSVDGELLFTNQLDLEIQRGDAPLTRLAVERPESISPESTPIPSVHGSPSPTPSPIKPQTRTVSDEWQSPAFLRNYALPNEDVFAQDTSAEEDGSSLGKGRKRTKLWHSGGWRYNADRSPERVSASETAAAAPVDLASNPQPSLASSNVLNGEPTSVAPFSEAPQDLHLDITHPRPQAETPLKEKGNGKDEGDRFNGTLQSQSGIDDPNQPRIPVSPRLAPIKSPTLLLISPFPTGSMENPADNAFASISNADQEEPPDADASPLLNHGKGIATNLRSDLAPRESTYVPNLDGSGTSRLRSASPSPLVSLEEPSSQPFQSQEVPNQATESLPDSESLEDPPREITIPEEARIEQDSEPEIIPAVVSEQVSSPLIPDYDSPQAPQQSQTTDDIFESTFDTQQSADTMQVDLVTPAVPEFPSSFPRDEEPSQRDTYPMKIGEQIDLASPHLQRDIISQDAQQARPNESNLFDELLASPSVTQTETESQPPLTISADQSPEEAIKTQWTNLTPDESQEYPASVQEASLELPGRHEDVSQPPRHRVDQLLDQPVPPLTPEATQSDLQKRYLTLQETEAPASTGSARSKSKRSSARLRSEEREIPKAISPWFSSRKSSGRKAMHSKEAREAEKPPVERMVTRSMDKRSKGSQSAETDVNGGTPAHTGSIVPVNGHAVQESQPAETTDETRDVHTAADRPQHGLQTSVSYYVPLSQIDRYLTASSQDGPASIDAFGFVTSFSSKPRKSKAGPRDFYTIMHVSDRSIYPSTVGVHCYRPYPRFLPAVDVGDVIILRDFVVKTRQRHPYLLSAAASAWYAWRFSKSDTSLTFDGDGANGAIRGLQVNGKHSVQPLEECNGPPVEVGKEERDHAIDLRGWYILTASATQVDSSNLESIKSRI